MKPMPHWRPTACGMATVPCTRPWLVGKTGPVVGVEFGTVPSAQAREALGADHWLHARGKLDSEQGRAIKKHLREVFYLDKDSWKKQVIDRADELTGKAIANLA